MLILTLCLFLSFDGSSVSTAQRSAALFVNPAGLGVSPGYEGIYIGSKNKHNIGISLSTLGFGVTMIDDISPSFTAGSGFAISKYFLLGYNYRFNNPIKHEISCISRPFSLVSVGLTVPVERDPMMRCGIGLRPLTNRVTLFCDAVYKYNEESLESLIYGVGIEPLEGLILSVKGNQEGNLDLGMEISFGNLKLWGESGKDFEQGHGSLILSRKRYPALPPRRKRTVKVAIKGSYPEMSEGTAYFVIPKREPLFYKLLCDLQRLEDRKDVECLFIRLKPYSMGMAQAEELRSRLWKLKETGKKIIVFSEGYGLGGYYLASVADHIILTPLGEIILPGIAAKKMYVKGTLDKLGIETDIQHVGKYKSAREMLEKETMSDEDREQISTLLDDIWEPMLTEIAAGRGIEKSKLEEYVNKEAFFNSDRAMELGLVDTLAYWYQIDDVLDSCLDKSRPKESINKSLAQEVPKSWGMKKAKVALLIAEGSIQTGESGYSAMPIIGGKYMGSETVSRMLEKIKKDKSIKALVFRVNSGGGDALASEIIAQALKRVSEEKPVIVSMGNVAGSGGYYIACFGDTIVADDFTITGSIGVFSIHFILKKLYSKLGITWETVKRGEHADAFSTLRHFTPEEEEKMKQQVEWYYDKFIGRVSEGRGLTKAQVDSIGQGRIWSGTRAKQIGLIDEIGGVLDAIDIACDKAEIKDPEIVIYPKPKKAFRVF
jgi:protease-4